MMFAEWGVCRKRLTLHSATRLEDVTDLDPYVSKTRAGPHNYACVFYTCSSVVCFSHSCPWQVAWGTYLKTLLVPGHMYHFDAVGRNRYFLVGESKSFAGREAREKGDAIGRPIAVSWFEKHRDLAQGPFYSVLGTVGVFAPIVAAWLVCSRSFLVCGYFKLGPGAFVTREHLRS